MSLHACMAAMQVRTSDGSSSVRVDRVSTISGEEEKNRDNFMANFKGDDATLLPGTPQSTRAHRARVRIRIRMNCTGGRSALRPLSARACGGSNHRWCVYARTACGVVGTCTCTCPPARCSPATHRL